MGRVLIPAQQGEKISYLSSPIGTTPKIKQFRQNIKRKFFFLFSHGNVSRMGFVKGGLRRFWFWKFGSFKFWDKKEGVSQLSIDQHSFCWSYFWDLWVSGQMIRVFSKYLAEWNGWNCLGSGVGHWSCSWINEKR